jgi:glucokinase
MPMDLIADIGATHTRCALIDDKGQAVAAENFESNAFASPHDVLAHYLGRRRLSDQPTVGALAIAAPVTGDRIEMTNLPWQFSQNELKAQLGLSRLLVINDFAAVAWALPALEPNDVRQVGSGEAIAREPLAVLGPGSGLGVSVLVPFEGNWTVLPGEGGNVSITTTTDDEAAIVATLRDATGFCAAETLVSGPGLTKIYEFLAGRGGNEETVLTPAAVAAAAKANDPLAVQALGLFFGLLGTIAGNLALTAGARGGVYVAGGIVPKLLESFLASEFRERFLAKGRYRRYLEAIPTFVVTTPVPALIGLRKLLGYR